MILRYWAFSEDTEILRYWALLKKCGYGRYWDTELFWKSAVMVDTEILCFLEKVRLAPRFADTEILCFLEKVRSTPRFADTEILYFLKKVRSRQIPPYSNSVLLAAAWRTNTWRTTVGSKRCHFGTASSRWTNEWILAKLSPSLGYNSGRSRQKC